MAALAVPRNAAYVKKSKKVLAFLESFPSRNAWLHQRGFGVQTPSLCKSLVSDTIYYCSNVFGVFGFNFRLLNPAFFFDS